MIVDRKRKKPLYRQIYDDINRQIDEGIYLPGSLLPSENNLCNLYEVERSTIRKALSLMVDDGRITKNPGLGSRINTFDDNRVINLKNNLLFFIQNLNNRIDTVIEPFNSKLLDFMGKECFKRGYTLLYKPFSDEETVKKTIQSCNPMGVFYTKDITEENYKGFSSKRIPVVMVNVVNPAYPSVCLDDRGGAKMVVEYLYALGHRHIAFIISGQRGQTQSERFIGYKDALDEFGIAFDETIVTGGDGSVKSGRYALRHLVEQGNLPSAIFAENDSMAIGVILEAAEIGIKVPDDLSVVGFDDIDQSQYISPSLTTVAVDYKTMSRAACMLLLDRIEKDSYAMNVNIYVPLTLVERESTKPLYFRK